MSIVAVSILLLIAYHVSAGAPFYSLIMSALLALILGTLCNCLSMNAVSGAWLIIYIGMQFLLPMADGRRVMVGFCTSPMQARLVVA